ncbi:hypothetical protein H112_03615 [Trichophyton rubrum D6]|uniref:Inhibitor I9 domain-containing protein n=3 Tax=Trichophyton TaxID=5550 RepID=F2SQS5_TRIRC|nr:uncharacterized protein TERG_04939 [Trichophyton rubrum CBS 118892]EZF23748.1 hypothetical protein H100_03621 [Trichophyton rubrum MR850]EZF42788.1 hypothetical protein H102_03614 [Trichophyton rubrum CBS 100081]EZF53432.1 hypothetical protein H103_03624 [Trichophyton rubrum CBS 288.86]EZF64042.1 hypothetical protein H104_03610 [Trichophyton rubrum CBS 289.86]EZF74661.1 hypothetical protein H105_03638 [Trichophyton soudanense CBS 452.61]EZF85337.1 hypothetical protein H110_03623 [Trichophy
MRMIDMHIFLLYLSCFANSGISRAKESAKKTGGTIRHEYKLIRGFTVEYPNDHNLDDVLKSNDHIHVEQDGPGPAKKVTTTSAI